MQEVPREPSGPRRGLPCGLQHDEGGHANPPLSGTLGGAIVPIAAPKDPCRLQQHPFCECQRGPPRFVPKWPLCLERPASVAAAIASIDSSRRAAPALHGSHHPKTLPSPLTASQSAPARLKQLDGC